MDTTTNLITRRHVLKTLVYLCISVVFTLHLEAQVARPLKLSPAHAAALNHQRRIFFQYDQPLFPRPSVRPPSLATALTSKANS